MSRAGNRYRRGDVICSALSLALCAALYASAPTAHAQASAQTEAVQQYDIPAGPLPKALSAWGAQSGKQLVFPPDLVAGKTSKSVSGRYASGEALTRLLGETGVSWEVMGDSTIVLKKAVAPTPPTTPAPKPKQRTEATETKEDATELETIVVTGTHIRGVQNNTVPVTILDKEYIESTGYSTATQLMESLPQNFASVNQSATASMAAAAGVVSNTALGSSVNLRGIGQGTTLILINGHRMATGMATNAVDISALPLSAVERVEILTDGASALYGSDAVGGVVNFILSSDFDGAETRLRYGRADPVDEYRISQALGKSWGSGNVLASIEYYKRDLLWARDRDFVPSTTQVGSLLPQDENSSIMLTGKQDISERVGVFADVLFTKRNSINFANTPQAGLGFVANTAGVDQVVANSGLSWRVGGDWQIEVAGNYAQSKSDLFLSANNRETSQVFEIDGAQATADGTLFTLPGGPVRMAIGVEWRNESYHSETVIRATGAKVGLQNLRQSVRSAFGEIYVPLIGNSNAIPLTRRLEISLAGRFDDYSSFGSSFDPQVGLMWEPIDGLRLRAAGGTSYKPPNLIQYVLSGNSGSASEGFDQVLGRTAYRLFLSGNDPDSYRAQQSENMSAGLEFVPAFARGLRMGINYYKIDYTDRIAAPSSGGLLGNDPAFASLIIPNPTAAQVAAAVAAAQLGQGVTSPNFDPARVEVIYDGRVRNLSATKSRGMDYSIDYEFDIAGGNAQFGAAATHIFESTQQVTATSASVDNVGFIYNVPDWRVRSYAAWQLGGWAMNLAANYVSSNLDNRRVPFAPISSFTTIDARLAYDFGLRSSGFLSGLAIALSATNIFDRNPPGTTVYLPTTELGFDPTNASPLGRMIAVDITKTW